jgi:uncharacterized protein (UPF0305 family)
LLYTSLARYVRTGEKRKIVRHLKTALIKREKQIHAADVYAGANI